MAVVLMVILSVTIVITLDILGVNAIAVNVALLLRAIFVRVIPLNSTSLVLTGRVAVFVVGANFGILVSLNTAVLGDRPFTIAVMTVSSAENR